MVSRVIPVDPFDLVIFGGTGDLARRKILPGLYRRFLAGQMTHDSRIIGAARADLTDESFRKTVGEALEEFVPAKLRAAADVAALRAEGHYTILYHGTEQLFSPWSISPATEPATARSAGFQSMSPSWVSLSGAKPWSRARGMGRVGSNSGRRAQRQHHRPVPPLAVDEQGLHRQGEGAAVAAWV